MSLRKRATELSKEKQRQASDAKAIKVQRAQSSLIDSLRADCKSLAVECNRLEHELNAVTRLSELIDRPAKIVVPKSRSNEAVPLFIWSDWHVDERVDRHKVGGLNEFDPDIAKRRIEKCISSTVKLIRHVKQSSKVRTVSIGLLGDFITGDIHDELSQTNTMGVIDAVLFSMRWLANGLATVANEVENVHVSCVVGNHGRFTKKMQFKNGDQKNFETIIYAMLAQQFDSKKFTWSVATGGINYVELIPGYWVRDFHGHQIKYGGGLGGVTVPLIKWIHRQDAVKVSQLNRMGHFHYFWTPTPNTLMNSSLKGYDEYAREIGCPFQRPLQACAVLDCTRKIITATHPVYCD